MRDRDKVVGIALIVLGALFLIGRGMDVGRFAWPLFVLVPGIIMLVSAFIGRRDAAGLAVPGAIVTTIGLVLFVLNGTGRWEAWSYCWALIVAGAGAGNFIFGALTKDHDRERDGLRTVYVGLILFAAFGVFFEFLIFGGFGGLGRWLVPLVLIGAGVYLLFLRDPQSPLPWVTPGGSAPDTPRDYVGAPGTAGSTAPTPPAPSTPPTSPSPATSASAAPATPTPRPAPTPEPGQTPALPDRPASTEPVHEMGTVAEDQTAAVDRTTADLGHDADLVEDLDTDPNEDRG